MGLIKGKTGSSTRPAAGRGGGGGFKFNYRPRSPEEVRERAQRAIGGREGPFINEVQFFTPRTGDNTVRILPPPTEEKAEMWQHYGISLFVHYGIGPDANAYLCLAKMKEEQCPLCDERAKASAAGEEALAKELRPSERTALWVIDRSQESKGPMLWSMSAGQDKDITKLVFDKSDGSVLPVDNPEDGYDLSFVAEGEGMKRKLKSYAFARRPSPLSDEEENVEKWLRYISEHPLDECLQFYDADHINKAYEGQAPAKSEEERLADEQERDLRDAKAGKGKGKEEPAKTPPAGSPRVQSRRPAASSAKEEATDEDVPSWEQLQELSEEDLADLGEEKKLEFPDDGFDSIEALRDFVAKKLGIEPPDKPAKTEGNKKSWREKLAGMAKK